MPYLADSGRMSPRRAASHVGRPPGKAPGDPPFSGLLMDR